MNVILKKRVKSFLWRICVVMVIAGVDAIVENVAGLGVPQWAVLMIGLAGGEVTKVLNTKHQVKKAEKAKIKKEGADK